MPDLVVYDHKGNQLALTSLDKGGGEGSIYSVDGRPGECAKIYKPHKRTPETRDKVIAMVNNAPTDPTWQQLKHRSIAWPLAALYEDKGATKFLGFTMPFVDMANFRQLDSYYSASDRLKRFGGGFTWKHLFYTARNLSSAVAAIHRKGHRVGDLREANILAGPNALVTLVDCDSFQVKDKSSGRVFFTRVGTPGYIPPELFGADFGRKDYDREHSDLFALGVLMFQLLMNGFHPYSARGPAVDNAPNTDDKIRKGYFAYSGKCKGASPPVDAPPYEILPPALRSLIERCFVDGHSNPDKRPAAKEWFEGLSKEGKKLRACDENENHWFGDHIASCPWCEGAQARKFDYFPSTEGTQAPLPVAQALTTSVSGSRTSTAVTATGGAGGGSGTTTTADESPLLGFGILFYIALFIVALFSWSVASALCWLGLIIGVAVAFAKREVWGGAVGWAIGCWAVALVGTGVSSGCAHLRRGAAQVVSGPQKTSPGTVKEAEKGQRPPVKVAVRIESTPSGATVAIDGNRVGETPISTEVWSGEHSVDLNKDGYVAVRQRLMAGQRKEETLNIILKIAYEERREGKVLSVSGRQVAIDLGEVNGITPGSILSISLSRHPIPDPRSASKVLGYEEGQFRVNSVELRKCLAVPKEEGQDMPSVGDEAKVSDAKPDPGRSTAPRPSARPREPSAAPAPAAGNWSLPQGVRPVPESGLELYTNTGSPKEVVHEKTGIQMVFIPAGELMMGSLATEKDHFPEEGPQHRVRITKPFYLGKYEVTQGEWQKVMGGNPAYFKGDRNPVEQVSWTDCQAFLGKAGDGGRLPTEAEWEYACRAGSNARFSFGDSDSGLGEYAWYEGNSGRKTHPVGEKKPNAWGLCEMHGNVWEWCSDWYDGGYYQHSPSEDPKGPPTGQYGVMRGGSWETAAPFRRSAYRNHDHVRSFGDSHVGLRVALSIPPAPEKAAALQSQPAPTSTPVSSAPLQPHTAAFDALADGNRLSIEAWFAFDRDPSALGAGRYYVVDKNASWRLWFTAKGDTAAVAGQFYFDLWDWHGISTKGVRWEANRLYYLAAVYDGSQVQVYLDGVLNNHGSLSKRLHRSRSPFAVGGNADGGETFPGRVQRVRVWNVALGPEALQRKDVLPAEAGGLVVDWGADSTAANVPAESAVALAAAPQPSATASSERLGASTR